MASPMNGQPDISDTVELPVNTAGDGRPYFCRAIGDSYSPCFYVADGRRRGKLTPHIRTRFVTSSSTQGWTKRSEPYMYKYPS